MAEPWRNGMIANFNDRYQQKFLRKVAMTSMKDLQSKPLCFEERRNGKYRYSKLKGNYTAEGASNRRNQTSVSSRR